MGLWKTLKNVVWNEDDRDEGYEQPAREAHTASFEPCAGKVILVKPDVYVNVGLLSSYLCAGYLVLMDLSGVTAEGARRILDFLSGAAYSRDGALMQISSKAYILAPHGVEISDWNETKGEAWEYDYAFNF